MSDVIEYILRPDSGSAIHFRINLDFFSDTYEISDPEDAPAWILLGNNQCSHCPLSTENTRLCPLAERVVPFVEKLSKFSSLQDIEFTVTQSGISKHMRAPMQDVLGSLLGLFVATSDCPYTRFLRPMAHFHLPLADEKETLYRVLSMYRLAQYFKKQTVGKAFAGFEELQMHYEKLVEVNHCLSKRMREALAEMEEHSDGTLNAINLLDALSQYVPASIDDAIEELEPIFNAYWLDVEPEKSPD